MPDPLTNAVQGAVQINRSVAKAVGDLNTNVASAVETAVVGAASLVPQTPSVATGQNDSVTVPLGPLNLPQVFEVASDTINTLLGTQAKKKKGRRIGPFTLPLSDQELTESEPVPQRNNIGGLSDEELTTAEDVPQSGDVRIH